MRIVAGKFRRRKLYANPGQTTRPIPDRIKETLFEFLEEEVAGRRVADVFAGTGTIGFEALSRDAAGVVFIESDRRAFELLQRNVAMLGVEQQTLCWRADVLRCSFRPKNVPHLVPFDVVFFDPPYRMVADIQPGSPISRSLERLARPDVAAPGALLVLRTPVDSEFTCPTPWRTERRIDFSTMAVHLFRNHQEPTPSAE